MVTFIISAYFLASLITPVYAAPGDPATISEVVSVLERIIGLLAPAAGIAFFFMMLVGGFKFLSSGGDPKAAGAARTTLTFAIIGIILVVASWLILKLIADLTGVDVTTVNLP